MSVARTKAEKVHKIFMVKICKEIFADGEICQKMKHYSFYSVISAIWDRSKYSNLILAPKFKSIRPSFSVITTPFSVNAQLHSCSTVGVSYQNHFRSISNFLKDDTSFLLRAKRAAYLFKTIGLQKTANGFWRKHDIISLKTPFRRCKK